MRMTTAQRQQLICQRLEDQGFVTVTDMAELCGASEMTIRRDLDRLAESGLLERTHGGAGPVRSNLPGHMDFVEPSIDRRSTQHVAEKAAIARKAAEYIRPDQTIALDIGTTTLQLARELSNSRVSIHTSSLKIAAILADARPMVYLLGGLVSGTEPSIIGARAINQLQQLNFETVFLGASSLSEDGVLYDYSLEDTEVKRALISVAKKTVVLLDSSKFNRMSVAKVCSAKEIDTLITDAPPPAPIQNVLDAAGVETLITE